MAGKMPLYKLVVLGDGSVGKTALTIQQYLNHFVETHEVTFEDSYRKQVIVDQQACLLEVLDTAGQEEHAALSDQWIRDGEGFILVYSITSKTSFTRIHQLYAQIKRVKETDRGNLPSGASYFPSQKVGQPMYTGPVPIMLVGNKSDKHHEREVSTQEGQDLARDLGCEFVEASAKNPNNVEKAFYDVIRQLREQRQPPMKPVDRKGTGTDYGPQPGSQNNGDSAHQCIDRSRDRKCGWKYMIQWVGIRGKTVISTAQNALSWMLARLRQI